MIQVVDAICGAGKTTWVFDYIRKHSDKKWVFVSPYLDEAGDGREKGRIQKELPDMHFISPSPEPSKRDSFLRHAKNGHNLAITHKLFTGFTPDIAVELEKQGYNLIIDETIDLVNFYEGIETQDVKFLIKAGMVLCSDSGILSWNEDEYPNYTGRDIEIKLLCEMECLWLYGDDVLIQRIPPTCMKACQSVTILTYMFEASLMHCWMQLNQMQWEYLQPPELRSSKEIKSLIRDNLNIIHPSRYVTSLQRTENGFVDLSKFHVGWYENQSYDDLVLLRKSIETTLKQNMRKGNVFWTTFKAYQSVLAGVGYKRAKKVDGVKRSPFVSKNMRASNEYKDCTNCIYTINIHPNGSLKSHLAASGVLMDRDKYALSELVQFIFRGSIREYKPMDLYILSDRMRALLEDWLLLDT